MISPYHTSGFYYAPLSKGLLGSIVISSVAAVIPFSHYRHFLIYNHEAIFEKYDIGRFLLCRSLFLDPKDILCASILIYHFRIFERRYGSLKYASFLAGSFALSLVFEWLCVEACHRILEIELDPLPCGPYGLVFALFVPYFCDIPRVAITHFLGIPVTGKSLTYIIGLQLASGSLESALLAVCGVAAGMVYRNNFFWVQSWLKVPMLLGRMVHGILGRLLHTPPPRNINQPIGATLEIQRQIHIEQLEQQMAWAQMQPRPRPANAFGLGLFGNRNNVRPPEHEVGRAPQPAAEDQIQRLVEMGFTRENVVQALQSANNDITMATTILLHQ